MKNKFFISLFLFLPFMALAQNPGLVRQKKVSPGSDTVRLDSLSILPSSLKFDPPLDSSCYRLNFAEGYLVWDKQALKKKGISADSITVLYQAFPFSLSKTYSHKDVGQLDKKTVSNPFVYKPGSKSNADIFNLGGLNKSGSISRGVMFGNNQDISVSSNLDLRLSGRLSENIDIVLAATDDNIPIQPDGTTQQLQEFDKVFIQLSDSNNKLVAGDFVLLRPNSYFMNYNKKAQGLSFTSVYSKTTLKNTDQANWSLSDKIKTVNTVTASAAVSKGKFARNLFQGIEGNQGPYRLRGAENELFIIVLSGSEKVYIDGELMERGADNDYIIDYNTAEIIFTPRQKITKDKRIAVEFQYSDKNYARSLYQLSDEFQKGKWKLSINYYSEQDNKNKPLQQQLNDTDRVIMANAGDQVSDAFTSGVDSVVFNSSEVLYDMRDTTRGSFTYNDIFVYSTDSSVAHYRLSFSYVGPNNGNYVQTASAVNGKVFKWVMPDTLTGQLRGSYEPVLLLVTPKQKEMLTAGIVYQFSKNYFISLEGAYTRNDINRFSALDKANDDGYGFRAGMQVPVWEDKSPDPRYAELLLKAGYEYVQMDFSPIERFRPVEFERDWNRSSSSFLSDQHLFSAGLVFNSGHVPLKQKFTAGYSFGSFTEGSFYTGMKHGMHSRLDNKKYLLDLNASFLQSDNVTSLTQFTRGKINAARRFKWITPGVRAQYEQNLFQRNNSDSLNTGSFQFAEWELYAQKQDTSKLFLELSYRERTDWLVRNYALSEATFARNYGMDLRLMKNPNSQLRFNATYRELEIKDTLITTQKPDNTLLGRAEYSFSLWKGALSSATFYEIGSGLELKKEYTFIEVQPGQGVYTWIDYNGNGVKELNEFETAAFPDQATYIKVFVPTDDYIKTFSNQFSQVLSLRPLAVWSGKTGFKKFLTRFASQIAYRVDRKSTDEDLLMAYNPFLRQVADSTLQSLNSSFRNTFYFNQTSSIFGADYTYQDNRNKQLLTNGFDSRENIYHEVRARWNITRKWTLQETARNGVKRRSSLFFGSGNYAISYTEAETKVSYQPGTTFRVSVSYKYTEKYNHPDLGPQKAFMNNFGMELKYNVLNKGNLQLKGNYIEIRYNDSSNTTLAFEMLDGLKTGQNITWGVSYQRNLGGNMQLSLTYDGRKSETVKTIHTGGAQVRAFF
ncbi:MAG: hypothetical protein AB1458_02965 [Bacteroidota bacterium]